METLHKVNFLHSVILWGAIIKYVELFTYKIFDDIEVIRINSELCACTTHQVA